MLVRRACELYIEDKCSRLRGNTIEGYVSALRAHVIPAFGEREIDSITHEELQSWVDSKPTRGSAEKAFKTFRQVFRWAVRRLQMRIWDITQGIDLPAKTVVRRDALTAAQEAEMLRGIWGQPWEAVVLAQAALGLRRSEACGLDWQDIDWRSGWVHIQRGAHWVSGRVVEYGCKTRMSDRWLKLPRWALERLRAIRGQRRRGRIRGALAPHQIATRFKRFCLSHALPWVTMMRLRHTWGTIAVASGAQLADVSVALGHASVDTFRQCYLLSERQVAARAGSAYEKAIGQALRL